MSRLTAPPYPPGILGGPADKQLVPSGAHRQAGRAGTAAAVAHMPAAGRAAGRAAAGMAAAGIPAVQAAEGRAARSPPAGSPAALVRHRGQAAHMAAGMAVGRPDHRAAPGCPARARPAWAERSAGRTPSDLAREGDSLSGFDRRPSTYTANRLVSAAVSHAKTLQQCQIGLPINVNRQAAGAAESRVKLQLGAPRLPSQGTRGEQLGDKHCCSVALLSSKPLLLMLS